MALFGRETQAEQQRAQRIGAWFQARGPLAVASLGLGILASIDFFTMVLGAVLGLVAIVLGISALAECRRRPELPGRPLAIAGITLGCVGILLSGSLFLWLRLHHHGPAEAPAP